MTPRQVTPSEREPRPYGASMSDSARAHPALAAAVVPDAARLLLAVNGGSSSIKFAAFTASPVLQRQFSGQVERVGLPGARLVATLNPAGESDVRPIDATTLARATEQLIGYLRERVNTQTVAGIGHRIVHGGLHPHDHQVVTEQLLAELRRVIPLDRSHAPREIALVEAFGNAFPSVPQVACFDTAFHRDLPLMARLLPIPRHYFNEGLRRFGFHGLSYTYLMQRIAEVAGPNAANGRIILAHLGSGASMAAIRGGKPIDTTMGFTPTAGLVMGTRPGDLDPGLLTYLMRAERMSPDDLDEFISHRCGLVGVSETSSDMRDLLNRRLTDQRATEAVDLFCYQARKFVGALHAALGGLDTLVFSGGIGEHSPDVRAGICEGLECLGVFLDPKRNWAGEPIISVETGRVVVRVIATDEELVIGQLVLGLTAARKGSPGPANYPPCR